MVRDVDDTGFRVPELAGDILLLATVLIHNLDHIGLFVYRRTSSGVGRRLPVEEYVGPESKVTSFAYIQNLGSSLYSYHLYKTRLVTLYDKML